ncbi:unnamed protein product [Periconia digitata]|uniref:Uncharacterized protein n=1 Tax=Periconia digitata TaxID=1303443 RepID=A0A9W4UQ33_9PLEO|nr:unnamed protein product [Periconia digitata]
MEYNNVEADWYQEANPSRQNPTNNMNQLMYPLEVYVPRDGFIDPTLPMFKEQMPDNIGDYHLSHGHCARCLTIFAGHDRQTLARRSPLACSKACGFCGTMNHQGMICPDLYVTMRYAKNRLGFNRNEPIPNITQIRPSKKDLVVLKAAGYIHTTGPDVRLDGLPNFTTLAWSSRGLTESPEPARMIYHPKHDYIVERYHALEATVSQAESDRDRQHQTQNTVHQTRRTGHGDHSHTQRSEFFTHDMEPTLFQDGSTTTKNRAQTQQHRDPTQMYGQMQHQETAFRRSGAMQPDLGIQFPVDPEPTRVSGTRENRRIALPTSRLHAGSEISQHHSDGALEHYDEPPRQRRRMELPRQENDILRHRQDRQAYEHGRGYGLVDETGLENGWGHQPSRISTNSQSSWVPRHDDHSRSTTFGFEPPNDVPRYSGRTRRPVDEHFSDMTHAQHAIGRSGFGTTAPSMQQVRLGSRGGSGNSSSGEFPINPPSHFQSGYAAGRRA